MMHGLANFKFNVCCTVQICGYVVKLYRIVNSYRCVCVCVCVCVSLSFLTERKGKECIPSYFLRFCHGFLNLFIHFTCYFNLNNGCFTITMYFSDNCDVGSYKIKSTIEASDVRHVITLYLLFTLVQGTDDGLVQLETCSQSQ